MTYTPPPNESGSAAKATEAMVRFRATMVLISVGLALPVSLVETLLGHWWPFRTAWLALVGLVAGAFRVFPPSRAVRLVAAGVFTLLGPLAVGLENPDFVQLATIGAMPLIAGVLFIRALDVVLVVTITGWVANTALFASVGWPWPDVISISLRLATGSVVMILAAWWTKRLNTIDLENDAATSRALRLSESRRAQAERLAIVGRLAAGVAHEINNPIAYVKANVGVLARHVRGQESVSAAELNEILDDTHTGIDRVCQIILDLKSYARDDSDSPEDVNVEEIVRQSVRLASVRLPANTTTDLTLPNLPMIRGNQRKLSQVLLNLLINAGDAFEEAQTHAPRISIHGEVRGDRLVLTIADNGPGLPADVQARLFEPFFTTKPPGQGTGLGLALSREYVEAARGTLTAENGESGGARFTLSLPLA